MKKERFEEYFKRYNALVIKMVVSKTGDYQAAEEICQHVFISFYQNMDHISPDLVKAWLLKCTKNSIVDYLRKPANNAEVMLDIAAAQNGNLLVEESVEIYEMKLFDRELLGDILSAVKEENERWYDVLVLYCLDGLSHIEIAERLNIPVTVLRARLHRAREFIKEHFGDEYKDRKP